MAEHSTTLYLAWQDAASSRRWFPIGRLRRRPDDFYEFIYIRGYEEAHQLAGMQPLLGFMDSRRRYLSGALFPHFQNRLMSPSREEYATYLERLGFTTTPQEPLLLLARSEGRRATDSFQVFEAPAKIAAAPNEHKYSICFFIHGTRYTRPEAQQRPFAEGERLALMADLQNPQDKNALMLRTEDNLLLGWVPRYYCADVLALRAAGVPIEVTVERVNEPSTPSWLRVLCKLTAPWPEGFRALASPEYQPLGDADDN